MFSPCSISSSSEGRILAHTSIWDARRTTYEPQTILKRKKGSNCCHFRYALVQSISTEVERRAPSEECVSRQLQPGECMTVREAQTGPEFERVGWLRARAFYEAQPAHRFQASFTKQFAEQEARSLLSRTRPQRAELMPEAVCIVAIRSQEPISIENALPSDSGNVIATADIRPPASAGGQHPQGVPKDRYKDEDGAYILNVVVDFKHRRQGYGKRIMIAAEELAARRWKAKRLYAHVSLGNKAAYKLYLQLGYDTHESAYGSGHDVLLCKSLPWHKLEDIRIKVP